MFLQPCVNPILLKQPYSRLILVIASITYFTACSPAGRDRPDHTVYFDSVIERTDALLNGGEVPRVISYIDSQYQAFQGIPGRIDLCRKYNYKVNYYLNYDKNIPNARLYADSMLVIIKGREQQYPTEYAGAMFAQGDVLMAEQKYIAAFKYYYDGRRFALKNLDSCEYGGFSSRLALVLYRQGKYLQSVPYLLQSLAEYRHCDTTHHFSETFLMPQANLNTIALCYEKAEKPDSAIYYYHRALAFIDSNAARFPDKSQFMAIARGVIYGNIGGVYVMLNNVSLAEKYLLASIRINSRPGYAVDDAVTAQIKLAKLYMQLSRYDAVNSLLQETETILDAERKRKNEQSAIRLKWSQLKWQYLEATGNMQQANVYMKQFYQLRDSINAVNTGLGHADIEESFTLAEQQYQMALLSKDNQLKTLYLAGIVLVALLTAIILLQVWYNLKTTRRKNHELTMLNMQAALHNTQMQHALNALEQSQEENTRVMKMVAHDLRNPVSNMIMAASLMQSGEHNEEENNDFLEMFRSSGNNCLVLINELLHTNRREEELKKEPVDLYELLHYCVALLRFKADAKQQQLVLSASAFTLSISREKMWRVISNLIANAIKFSASGTTITVRLQQYDRHVCITVQDQGIGIPDNMKDKVFDMFTGAKRAGTAGEEPFGMGLAISRQIVEAHGGSIWFESKPGVGTCFFVELPVMD